MRDLCKYQAEYEIRLEQKGLQLFRCQNYAYDSSGYCEFHHNSYYKTNEQNLCKLFKNMISDAIDNNKDLLCVGYKIPAVESEFKEFPITVVFYGSEFYGKVDFSNVVFLKVVTFARVIFHDVVKFNNTKFKDSAEFFAMEFKSNVHFREAYFAGEYVSFVGSKFNNVFFQDATFQCEGRFTSAIFNSQVYFADAQFKSLASFRGTNFKSNAYFYSTKFGSAAHFKDIQSTKGIFFKKVFFEFQEQIEFTSDLSNFSFEDTNINRIPFHGSTWNSLDVNKKKKNLDTHKIFDERRLENDDNISLDSVLASYRNLRENYDFHLNYEESGKFFVRESEVKRLYKINKGITERKNWVGRNFSLSNAYKKIANYGESYKLPLGILVITFLFFTSVFIYQEYENCLESTDPCHFVEEGLRRSLAASADYSKDDDHKWDFALRLIILPLLVISFIGIRRKLERKLRH